MSDVLLDPAWRQAVADFLATSPQPGDVVTREQLEAWLGMKRPRSGTWEGMKKFELNFLRQSSRWRDELMETHQIQLEEKSREAGGWKVLHPADVASYSRKTMDRDALRALAKQRRRLACTDLSGLTPPQLREHAEATVRASWKRAAIIASNRRAVELPALPAQKPRLPAK